MNKEKQNGNFIKKVSKIFVRNRYFFGRLLISLITLFLACILIFSLLMLMPGDIVENYAMKLSIERQIPYESARRLAVQMLNFDPDEPIFTQFFRYVGGLFQGNLGQSIYMNDLTANDVIAKGLPWTLFISASALFISYFIGTQMGSRMAWKREGAGDVAFSSYIVVSSSVPDYLFGLIILYIFAYNLHWFPTNGAYEVTSTVGFNLPFIWDCIKHAFLPICAYVFTQVGSWALMMKGSAVGVLGDDYVNAAIARGLPERVIVNKYLKKNAKLPLVTSLAISFAYLFGGSAIMETIFNYPGIGYAFGSYIGSRDYFVMQGLFFFISMVVIFANLISDSIYSLVDPRVRRGL